MVLYRKYRPQKFSDLVGQEHIVQTLTNALASQRVGHGFLFAGPRGLGKTTLARILAKALNCTGRKLAKDSFEPCNKCVSCKEIVAGKSLDIIEIDAASNRGINEIRELREKIRFAPSSAQYKVYIIDEVHMLTKEAFNALLKTLEEPPLHAIFIMATTEPHKVPATIISRVQRFDFHKATIEEIAKLVSKVAKAENIKIDDEAQKLLAQLSFGSYRDSLSLLEQVSSLRQTAASRITLEGVQQILGLAQEKVVFDFIELLDVNNRQQLFDLISKLYYQGVDLENFTQKLVETLRKIALFKIGENQLFDLTKEQQQKVKQLAEKFDLEQIMIMIQKFVLAIPQVKAATLPQLPLEMIVYEITKTEIQNAKINPPAVGQNDNSKLTNDESSTINTTDEIKQEVGTSGVGDKVIKSQDKKVDDISEAFEQKPVVKFSKEHWPEVIKQAREYNHNLAVLLKDAALVGTEEDKIILAFKFKFHANLIAGAKNTRAIETIIEKVSGNQYRLDCIVDPGLVIKAPVNSEEELLNGAREVFEVEE